LAGRTAVGNCSGLRLGNRRREVASYDYAGEILTLVGAVAERSIGGVAAAAKAEAGSAAESKGFAILIDDFEIAFYAHGTIIKDGDFG